MTSTENKIKNIIRAKGILKSKLTRFGNFLQSDVLAVLTPSNSLTETDALDIQTRLNRIQPSLLDEFEKLQEELFLLYSEEELENVEKLAELGDESEEFEKSYFSKIAIARNLLNQHNAVNSINVSVQSGGASATPSVNDSSGLKPIDIPKFSGKYDDWLEFREVFNSLVHSNCSVSNIRKFHYLRGALVNEALQVIQAIEFSDCHYNTAWQVLCDRYDNEKLLIFRHVKCLFSLEPITKPSADKIRGMIDTVNKHLRCLKQLKEPVEHWDTLLIFLLSQKLDSATSNGWEQKKSTLVENPVLSDFTKFLKDRADFLETLQVTKEDVKPKSYGNVRSFYTGGQEKSCLCCNKAHHFIQNCEHFLKMPHSEKIEIIKSKRLCMCCLKPGHNSKMCKSKSCTKCRYKHHVVLHLDYSERHQNNGNNTTNARDQEQIEPNERHENDTVVGLTSNSIQQVLLSTALIKVCDRNNQSHVVRCLLDNGSMSSFMTQSLCNKLGLKSEKINICVSGVNQATSQVSKKCTVNVKSIHSEFEINVNCLVLPSITSSIPNFKIDLSDLNIPKSFILADPGFHTPAEIDMLIGNELFYEILSVGQHKLGKNKPVLQKTQFGWIVAGPLLINVHTAVCNFSRVKTLDIENLEVQQQLTKFWALEECGLIPALSEEEKQAEEHFVKNTIRLADGRFQVRIPFKESLNRLGNSFHKSKRQFYALEKRLLRNSNLRSNYVNYMLDFEDLGFMKKLQQFDEDESCYVIPHHGVERPESLTSPLRVVYNASMATTLNKNVNGVSLNDVQMVGPVVQNELLTTLIRFRQYNYVVSADVSKMYCQISVSPDQRKYQRILWRQDPSEELSMYEMTRVVFGMASSPFLATRCIKQLALDCRESNPKISNIIDNGFYVDDFLSGGSTIEEVIHICDQVSEILKSACFPLRKWNSNSKEVLVHVSNNHAESESHVQIGQNETVKLLGLIWSSNADELKFKITSPSDLNRATKRIVLSHIARIFDPLHLLAPCTIIAKMLLQKIWLYKLSWDDSLPVEIDQMWKKFQIALPALEQLSVPRQIVCKNAEAVEIHAFADASEGAYGGAVYIRSTNNLKENFINLVCAKSKVSPLKTVTIPKLELCAAVITSRLVKKVLMSTDLKYERVTLWSDSTIVLGWLKMAPNTLKPFISNRVSEIQELTSNFVWQHVPTNKNPADLITRGVLPDQLLSLPLWWNGPDFLKCHHSQWPTLPNICTKNLPEVRKKGLASMTITTSFKFPFKNFSNVNTLKRVTARILRLFHNSKRVHVNNKLVGPLTTAELSNSMKVLMKIAQHDCFPTELNKLIQVQTESSSQYIEISSLKNLNPFLDQDQVMRVGGRLQNSNFDYNKIHPVILSSKHHLTELLFLNEHLRLLHAGPQLTLASLRERYWPIRGRNLAKKIVHRCVTCVRNNPKSVSLKMGNLPASRLKPGSVFEITGVDYAGPFLIKNKKGRGGAISKCWIALFICFATKAIHLELVTQLNTECFIQAFRRFAGRRGKPSIVYSDNGTNFVGACSKLKDLGKFLSDHKNGIAEAVSVDGIEWRFIPPSAPHFGGLWESGVKSCKHHLHRVMGEAHLTFEEFYTLLVQVEAVVNSRPLFSISDSPYDPVPITPAHFLIGRSLVALPDADVRFTVENRLSTYERVQKLAQHFWERWSKEYLSHLQLRQKWTKSTGSLKKDQIVLIKEDNVPVSQWRMGRILELVPGKDGINRVAIVKTAYGTAKRAFTKLCPLPTEQDESQSLPLLKDSTFQDGGDVGKVQAETPAANRGGV